MDFDSVLPFVTGRDIVADAAGRHRPLLVDPEQFRRHALDSMFRMLGHSADETDDGTAGLGQEEPILDNLPGDLFRPGASLTPRSAGIIDDGVYRIPPGTDPFHHQPKGAIPLPIAIPGSGRGPKRIPISDTIRSDVDWISDRPAGRAMSSEAARSGSSARAVTTGAPAGVHSPASDLRPVFRPLGANSSPAAVPASSNDRSSAPVSLPASSQSATGTSFSGPPAAAPTAADGHASGGPAVTFQPTAVVADRIAATTAQQMATLANRAAASSVDQLRQEIFANQAARNSLFSH